MPKPKLTVIEGTPKPARKRKAPDEWRAMNRAAKVKDGRPVMLAFDNDGGDDFILVPCYWHPKTKQWWPLHTGPELPNFDPAEMLYGDPRFWRPFPDKPVRPESIKRDAKKETPKKVGKKASRTPVFAMQGNGFSMGAFSII